MNAWVKWGLVAIGAALVVGALAPAIIYLTSEALIVRRYTLPSSIVHAARAPADIAWGKHLATLYGCRDCHGADLTGRMQYGTPGLAIAAPNLRHFVMQYTDADFDRAVRRGLAPSARALWLMPSDSYIYMRDSDLAAIIAYTRALPPKGPGWPAPRFDLPARLAVLAGRLAPVDPYDMGRHTPLSVGPRYDGGRYLAAMTCSSCHGTDLTGKGAAGDLKTIAAYSRAQFFGLLRSGRLASGRRAPAMARLAGARFQAFRDYEIDALYAYLKARARAPEPATAH